MADLLVVNLLTHLAGHGVADLGVDSVAFLLIGGGALLAGNVPELLLGNQGTFPLIDDLALSLSPGGALLLHDGGALLLVPGAALLVKLIGAFLLMDDLLDSPGQVNALHLGDTVTFLFKLLLASLLDVVGSLAILLVLETALLSGDR